jgi:tRNA (cytidine56-2'-O)-methyltransferase
MTDEIIVFRYGHRIVRDYRVTSHCSLVARAFGAKKIVVCGEKDESMKKSVDDISERWGGEFKVEFVDNWKEEIENLKERGWKIVHLTMYGKSINEKEEVIKKEKKICVVIGSQKVEREVYEMADYNVSVTNQPHSEIAALAVALDRVQEGKELEMRFKGEKKRIVPEERGKKVIDLK